MPPAYSVMDVWQVKALHLVAPSCRLIVWIKENGVNIHTSTET
jgi:hypothetical protein